jgi:ATP/maltotriose-dependent transcriptional regulator MalT
VHLFSGDVASAADLVEEGRFVTEVTGSPLTPYGEIGLSAVRGVEDQAEPLIERWLSDVVARGDGVGMNLAYWARAVLCNGAGRYEEAVEAGREATVDTCELGPPQWALAELVEAGARSGQDRTAAAALEQLSTMARASGTDWALGIEASRCALLREGPAADALHREAIERLSRTTVRVELARAQLLYGEWLRREGRRADARAQLRTAHVALTAMGVGAFAERARRELLATGQTVRKRTVATSTELTAQEGEIVRLVAEGLTNPEVGAALFLSHRTVEWHLRKIFAKLNINSRRQLRVSVRNAERTMTATPG